MTNVVKVIKEVTSDTVQRFRLNWHYSLLFALVFAGLGLLIPDVYFRHFDTRNYYRIKSATVMQDEVPQCNDFSIIFDREADLNLQANAVVEVVLVRIDGVENEVIRYDRQIGINKGSATVMSNYTLPCNIPLGVYFVRGTVKYEVRGGQHITAWHTDGFTVVPKEVTVK